MSDTDAPMKPSKGKLKQVVDDESDTEGSKKKKKPTKTKTKKKTESDDDSDNSTKVTTRKKKNNQEADHDDDDESDAPSKKKKKINGIKKVNDDEDAVDKKRTNDHELDDAKPKKKKNPVENDNDPDDVVRQTAAARRKTIENIPVDAKMNKNSTVVSLPTKKNSIDTEESKTLIPSKEGNTENTKRVMTKSTVEQSIIVSPIRTHSFAIAQSDNAPMSPPSTANSLFSHPTTTNPQSIASPMVQPSSRLPLPTQWTPNFPLTNTRLPSSLMDTSGHSNGIQGVVSPRTFPITGRVAVNGIPRYPAVYSQQQQQHPSQEAKTKGMMHEKIERSIGLPLSPLFFPCKGLDSLQEYPKNTTIVPPEKKESNANYLDLAFRLLKTVYETTTANGCGQGEIRYPMPIQITREHLNDGLLSHRVVSPKFNGTRVEIVMFVPEQYEHTHIIAMGRSAEFTNLSFAPIVKAMRTAFDANQTLARKYHGITILSAELVKHDKHDIFFVYDCVQLMGVDLKANVFHERYAYLAPFISTMTRDFALSNLTTKFICKPFYSISSLPTIMGRMAHSAVRGVAFWKIHQGDRNHIPVELQDGSIVECPFDVSSDGYVFQPSMHAIVPSPYMPRHPIIKYRWRPLIDMKIAYEPKNHGETFPGFIDGRDNQMMKAVYVHCHDAALREELRMYSNNQPCTLVVECDVKNGKYVMVNVRNPMDKSRSNACDTIMDTLAYLINPITEEDILMTLPL